MSGNGGADDRNWGAFLRWLAGAAFAFALAAFAFNVLVDPYGANPLRLRFERPLMDINQRFMYPQVIRSHAFDSAVFGTSTVRLLKPAELDAAFGGHFANFGMNAATPYEQSQAVGLFLRETPDARTIVWGLDSTWCEPDADTPAKRLTELAGQNELAELIIATVALKERRYGATESALETISQDTFTGITAGILRAWALVGERRFDEADALVAKLGDTGLEDFLVFHRALMAEVAGDKEKALELAAKAFENEPYVARMVEVYSRMLANEGRFDEAADVIASFEDQGLTHPLVTVVKEAVEAKNQADALIHSTEKALSEHGDKVSAEEKTAIETAIAGLKEAVKADDSEDIKAKTNTLAQASMKLGEAMYKAQQAEGQAGASPGDTAAGSGGAGEAKDEKVVDAEFEDVTDKNKKTGSG